MFGVCGGIRMIQPEHTAKPWTGRFRQRPPTDCTDDTLVMYKSSNYAWETDTESSITWFVLFLISIGLVIPTNFCLVPPDPITVIDP